MRSPPFTQGYYHAKTLNYRIGPAAMVISRTDYQQAEQRADDARRDFGVVVAKLRLRLRREEPLQAELLALVDQISRATGKDPAEESLPDAIVAKGVEVIRAELDKAEQVQ